MQWLIPKVFSAGFLWNPMHCLACLFSAWHWTLGILSSVHALQEAHRILPMPQRHAAVWEDVQPSLCACPQHLPSEDSLKMLKLPMRQQIETSSFRCGRGLCTYRSLFLLLFLFWFLIITTRLSSPSWRTGKRTMWPLFRLLLLSWALKQ